MSVPLLGVSSPPRLHAVARRALASGGLATRLRRTGAPALRPAAPSCSLPNQGPRATARTRRHLIGETSPAPGPERDGGGWGGPAVQVGMPTSFQDQVVVITGASAGIGAALAAELDRRWRR